MGRSLEEDQVEGYRVRGALIVMWSAFIPSLGLLASTLVEEDFISSELISLGRIALGYAFFFTAFVAFLYIDYYDKTKCSKLYRIDFSHYFRVFSRITVLAGAIGVISLPATLAYSNWMPAGAIFILSTYLIYALWTRFMDRLVEAYKPRKGRVKLKR